MFLKKTKSSTAGPRAAGVAAFAAIALIQVLPARAQSSPTPSATPVDPARARMETEAEGVIASGEDKMKVADYDDAIDEFRNVLKRYPDTDARYTAQFRMADALVALKRSPEAVQLLQSVIKEESLVYSPQALVRLGDLYVGDQNYPDALRSYRQVIRDYPNSPTLDRAHYDIGALQFKLGHFEQASDELEQVGMSYAAGVPSLQCVSPGEPLELSIIEPNLIAGPNTSLSATVTSTAGDSETVSLRPTVEGGDTFYAELPTVLADTAHPGDGILQLYGSDPITVTYKQHYAGGPGAIETVKLPVASNGRLFLRDLLGNEIRGVVLGDSFVVEVDDADRDLTPGRDTVTVDLKTRRQDAETLTLTETGNHTGIFTAQVKTVAGTPQPGSGIVETDAAPLDEAANQLDDAINLTYMDQVHLRPGVTGPFAVKATLDFYAPSKSQVAAVEPQIDSADLDIKSRIYQGRSLVEIAKTYRDLGQADKGQTYFVKAKLQFEDVLTKYPNAPEVEDALFGLFQLYVAEEDYQSAVGVISEITRKFPDSTRASEALLSLADLHVKQGEYALAIDIYGSLVARAHGTPAGAEAELAIADTYAQMLKAAATQVNGPAVTLDQTTGAYEDFVRDYPDNEKVPDALFQLTELRFENHDYPGTVSSAQRTAASYPDNPVTGRVLLLEGQAQLQLHQIVDARATFANIIANYGDEADDAQKMMSDLDAKYPNAAPAESETPAASAPAPAKSAAKPAAKPAAHAWVPAAKKK